MFLKRCNDWLKVFIAFLIVGVFYCAWWFLDETLKAPTDMYVLTACVIIMVIYHIFAGILMKDVKSYKIISIYVAMLVVACIMEGWIGRILVGGPNFLSNFFDSFLEDGWQGNIDGIASYVLFSIIVSALIPLVAVLLGKWIGKRMDKKKQSTQE